MKAVMYHYVRPGDGGLPHLRYLPLDRFRRQLDHLEEAFGIAGRGELDEALATGRTDSSSVVLTFDDGLRDHHEHVLPELARRGHWAVFYVPTLPLSEGRMLHVHKVHATLGRHGGPRTLAVLESLLADDDIEPRFVEQLRDELYRGHVEDAATARVKRVLNYYVRIERRDAVCDALYRALGGDQNADVRRHYMAAPELAELRDAGMTIGAHSVSHRLLSQLSPADQTREIGGSLAALRGVLGEPIDTFCFPYGGDHSFDEHTLSELSAAGVRYGFSVASRDIAPEDLSGRPLALPRYDCNEFPHGRAAGVSVPER